MKKAYWQILILTLVSVGIAIYGTIHVQRIIIASQQQTDRMAAEIAQLTKDKTALLASLEELQAEVYDGVYPALQRKARPVTSSEVWQRNFYAVHQRRIERIDRKLLDIEQRLQRLESR